MTEGKKVEKGKEGKDRGEGKGGEGREREGKGRCEEEIVSVIILMEIVDVVSVFTL